MRDHGTGQLSLGLAIFFGTASHSHSEKIRAHGAPIDNAIRDFRVRRRPSTTNRHGYANRSCKPRGKWNRDTLEETEFAKNYIRCGMTFIPQALSRGVVHRNATWRRRLQNEARFSPSVCDLACPAAIAHFSPAESKAIRSRSSYEIGIGSGRLRRAAMIHRVPQHACAQPDQALTSIRDESAASEKRTCLF